MIDLGTQLPLVWMQGKALSGQLAYIDPGTGSLLFQVLVAGFLGAIMGFRNLRSWLALRLSRLLGRGKSADQVSTAESDAPAPRGSADTPDRS